MYIYNIDGLCKCDICYIKWLVNGCKLNMIECIWSTQPFWVLSISICFFLGGDRIHSKVLGMKFWCRQSVPEIGVNIGRKELEENPGEARWVSWPLSPEFCGIQRVFWCFLCFPVDSCTWGYLWSISQDSHSDSRSPQPCHFLPRRSLTLFKPPACKPGPRAHEGQTPSNIHKATLWQR